MVQKLSGLSNLPQPPRTSDPVALSHWDADVTRTLHTHFERIQFVVNTLISQLQNVAFSLSRDAITTTKFADDVDFIRTAGFSEAGDEGDGLYARADSEPSHAGKVQSEDGAWWELVPVQGRWTVEQFGAVNGPASDNLSAIDDAIAATISTHNTLVAKRAYGVSDTVVFGDGRYSFEGPDWRSEQKGANLEVGLVWLGANNKPIVEMNDLTGVHIHGLVVTNKSENAAEATGTTGILCRNTSSGAAAISNNQFDFLGIYGCHRGLQIGDFTNDGYDSNWEQNVIENIHFFDVANPVIIDSDNQDNITINYFHSGGPMSLSAHVGTRDHIIHAKRNGNGLCINSMFARTDGIVTDNAAIRIDDGSFTCGYCSMEGATTARMIDLNDGSSRDQCVLQKVVSTGIADTSGRAMILGHKSGTVLIGCSVDGDIECQRPVYAISTVFESGSWFTTSGSAGSVVHVGTGRRSGPGSALDANFLNLDLGLQFIEQEAKWESSVLNASDEDVFSGLTMSVREMDEWQIIYESSNDLTGVFTLYVYRNAGGNITGHVSEVFDDSSGTVITVTDNGASYTINVENTAANNKQYAGFLKRRERFNTL